MNSPPWLRRLLWGCVYALLLGYAILTLIPFL